MAFGTVRLAGMWLDFGTSRAAKVELGARNLRDAQTPSMKREIGERNWGNLEPSTEGL